jgi:hypothetical protein
MKSRSLTGTGPQDDARSTSPTTRSAEGVRPGMRRADPLVAVDAAGRFVVAAGTVT